MGLVYDDLPTKERLKLYTMKQLSGLSKKDLKNKEEPEEKSRRWTYWLQKRV